MPRARRTAVWRVLGFTCAVVLGAVAIWLIVTGTSVKATRIGALAGFWGLLIGALAVFGTRHPHAAPAVEAPPADQQARQELQLRAHTELVRAQEEASRRQFEARLEAMLRQQIQATLSHEVASLRSEVASLRGELLDKVGGQLRLERIETTRVIGSDIEALQREVNQLKATRASRELQQSLRIAEQVPVSAQVIDLRHHAQPDQPHVAPPHPVPPNPVQPNPAQPPVVQPAAVQAVPVQRAPARPAPDQQPATPRPPAPVQHRPPLPPEPSPQPDPPQPDPPQPDPPHPIPAAPAARRAADADIHREPPHEEFAGLPRLRPFTDFELDPIEPDYSGRRRAADAAESGPRPGRHGAEEESGGRRRAEDGHDVLARILRRENVR
jgi:hypothetical protein